MSTPPDSPPNLLETLRAAADGLLFPSETDAPLVPFEWPDAGPEVSAQSVAQAVEIPEGTPIEEEPLQSFFDPATAEEDWHNDEEKATARRFQNLVQVLEASLGDARAFRVGEIEIDVYIVGRAGEGLAGVQTKVVET